MTMLKRLRTVLLTLVGALAVTEAANTLTATESFSLITPAEARVGRPLTPVSVAGVARRTVRRCAVGVYYC
jgi:hypothetical protein